MNIVMEGGTSVIQQQSNAQMCEYEGSTEVRLMGPLSGMSELSSGCAAKNGVASTTASGNNNYPRIIIVNTTGETSVITRTEPLVKVVPSVAVQPTNKPLSDRTCVINPAVASVETDSAAPVAGGDKVDVERSNNGEMSAATAVRTVMLQSQQQPTQLQNECRAEESDGSGVPLTTAVTITVSDSDRRNESVYQYVDQQPNVDLYTGNPHHPSLQYGTIYGSPTDSAIQYPYYNNSGQVSGSAYNSSQQGINPQGNIYINPSGGSHSQQHSPSDDEAQHLSHTTRASPATIQWLLANYETADGVSLPRCTLYNHYLRHCSDNRLDPVNAASFGKLIRSVFLGLRTRRLGTRGNSKYHYYGIRIKPDSVLNRVSEDTTAASMHMARRQEPQSRGSKYGNRIHSHNSSTPVAEPMVVVSGGMQVQSGPELRSPVRSQMTPTPNVVPTSDTRGFTTTPAATEVAVAVSTIVTATPVQQQIVPGTGANNNAADVVDEELDRFGKYLCRGMAAPQVPPPSDMEYKADILQLGLQANHVNLFCDAYKRHCAQLLGYVERLKFEDVERCWHIFWQGTYEGNGSAMYDDPNGIHGSSGLTWGQLHALCSSQTVLNFVEQCDFQFYKTLVTVLLPNVLRPIPGRLLQNIRNFAKGSEGSLTTALAGVPEPMTKIKLSAIAAFAQTLRRYTSLSHLAQAAREVLQNQPQIQQMLSDLNRVNFKDVQEQASWVCLCDAKVIEELERDFKNTLEKQQSLEEWAEWLMQVVERMLRPAASSSVREFTEAARQFLLKWSFYSSMVIRDLTLRSAASFGSFHLIRLLYDEYIYYLVENKIAQATQQSPSSALMEGNSFMLSRDGGSSQIQITRFAESSLMESQQDGSSMQYEGVEQSLVGNAENHPTLSNDDDQSLFDSGHRSMSGDNFDDSEALSNPQRLNLRSNQSGSVQLDKTNGKIIIVNSHAMSPESTVKRMKTE